MTITFPKLIRYLPHALTLTSLALGIFAIILLTQERFILSAILIILGAICDLLDGHAARKLNVQSSIGKPLDSLADMVTFGTAPALFVYYVISQHHPASLFAAYSAAIFAITGALRLARFTAAIPINPHFFQGLPIPAAAITIIVTSLTLSQLPHTISAILVTGISLLMVSTLPYMKAANLKKIPQSIWLLPILIIVGMTVSGRYVYLPLILISLYIASGPILFFHQTPPKLWPR